MRTFARFVKRGDIVLNVGAHVGIEAIVFGTIVGPQGRLFIFEPYSVSHKLVLDNVYLNNLQNITTVYKIGASNEKKKGVIMINQDNPSGSMVFTEESLAAVPKEIREGVKSWGKQEEIFIDLVDDVLPIDVQVNFALIDVERLEI